MPTSMPLPAVSEIPEIEDRIEHAIRNMLESYGFPEVFAEEEPLSAPSDVEYLFRVRYNIEKELRELSMGTAAISTEISRVPVPRLLNSLLSSEVVPATVIYGVREVYRICSTAIHGEEVEQEHVEFVRRTAPELIATLRAIADGELGS